MSDSNNFDDDDLDDDVPGGPDYQWFQGPAPTVRVTFSVAAIVLIWTAFQHHQRVQQLKIKFGQQANFQGALRYSVYISAYVDNDDPTFAIARLVGKSTVFLGLMQLNFTQGFLTMLALLVLESSLDTVRILLAYWSCHSMRQLRDTSADEAKDLDETARLEPTNVYEDLARPMPISIMVFSVQSLLIGFVMYDTYSTTTRTCFNGNPTDVCPMLASLGSYCLYYLGTFMACVFYVGPLNSYGKKEHDPVFWLKLFVLSKQSRAAVLSWNHPTTEQTQTMPLKRNDGRIWMRFFMSLIVNSVCFHFLLNVLPVQIASKSSIMGIVFSSVGMIYLVDLDDTTGQPLTLLAAAESSHSNHHTSSSASDSGVGGGNSYDSIVGTTAMTMTTTTTTTVGARNTTSNTDLEATKQRLLEEAIQEIRSKLEVELAVRSSSSNNSNSRPGLDSSMKLESITHALFLSTTRRNEDGSEDDQHRQGVGTNNKGEETPLMTA